MWGRANGNAASAYTSAVLGCGLALLAAISTAHGEPYVAGVKPDRRPEGAPVVNAFVKSPEWYASALKGVTQPVPQSLSFLDSQGGWFTPFNHPGMTGPYDIRGLHGANAGAGRAQETTLAK